MIRVFLVTLSTSLSFYRHNKSQAIFVLLGLVLGCGLFISVAQINASAKKSYSEADMILGTSAQLRITDRQQTKVAIDDYIELRRTGFTSIFPVIETRLPTKQNALVSIIATDLLSLPISEARGDPAFDNSFDTESWNKLVQSPYEIWVPPQTAKELGIVSGEQIELRDGRRLPPAIVKAKQQQGDRIFMDIGAALDILKTDRFSYLAAGVLTPQEHERFEMLYGDRFKLETNTDAIDLVQLTQSLHTNLTALGLLSFIVGIFIVFNAVHFSMYARQPTLAVLRDLGASPWLIFASIVTEGFIWSLLGAILGTLIAQPISSALMPTVATTMQNLYGASVSSVPFFNAALFLKAFMLALTGLCLGLVLPLWLVFRRKTVLTNGFRKISASPPNYYFSALLGLLMLLTATLAYPHASTLIQGFGLLSLVLFAGISLLPFLIVLTVAGGRVSLARGWLNRWAVADVLRQLPHLRLAMMALLLTLIANIGVTSLVGSFRLALTDWLATRLSADLYIGADAISAPQLLDQTWLKAAHQRNVANVDFSARKAMVIGLSAESPDFLPTSIIDPLPNAFARWADPSDGSELIFANEQVRYLAEIEQGESITLSTTFGPRKFIVGGFFHDYGNMTFTFHLREDLFATLYPDGSPQGWNLWVKPGRMKEAELALIEMGVQSSNWVAQSEVLTLSMAIFDRTFAITQALNTLTLIIAAVAIFASILAVYQFRRPEYALWRALGIQWPQFFWLTGFPVVLTATIVMALALPLGVALSWLLIHKINVISFGWTMPIIIDAGSIAFLFGLVLCSVLTAFIIASLGQQAAISEALKNLAGEQ